MQESSISDLISDIETVVRATGSEEADLKDALNRCGRLPWGVAEAARLADIGLAVSARLGAGPSVRGDGLLLAAKALRIQSRFKEASQTLKRARGEFTCADEDGLARCDLVAGAIQAETGRLAAAVASYRRAERGFRRVDDLNCIATCTFNRGLIHFQRCQLVEAFDCYRSAREIFTKLGRPLEATVCEMNMGNVHNVAGRYQEALETFVSARDSFMSLGDRDRAARCRLNAGNAFAGSKRHKQAISMLQAAKADFDALGNDRMIAACELNSAGSLIELGEFGAAEANLRTALRLFSSVGDLAGVGECHLLLAKVEDSPANGLSALQCFQRLGDHIQVAASHSTLAKSSATLDPEAHWRQALKSVRKALSSKNGPELKHSVSERFFEIGPALVGRALARKDVKAAAQIAVESDFDLARFRSPAPAALVRYQCDEEFLHALVYRAGTSAAASTRISRERVRALAAGIVSALSQPGRDANDERREMYDLLIKPLLRELPERTVLNIVPGYLLRQSPLAALISETGQCLVEERAVITGSKSINDREPAQTCAVLTRSEFGGGLPSLPSVEDEARYIRTRRPQAQCLHQERATVANAVRELESVELAHIATHAIENRKNPHGSALVFEPDDGHPSGLLYASEISRLRIKADLIVLSACGTSAGERSLAQAFLSAGAKCVVASSWRALDEATVLWMRSFYESYFETGKVSEAHQTACKHMIVTRFSSAHYWALWNLLS